MKQPTNIWLPSFWASEAIDRFSQEGFSGARQFLSLLITTGIFCLFLSYWFWLWLYREGYSKTQEASRAIISRRKEVQGLL
ncbi:MAG: hypothetical protein QXH58_03110, partial [Nitrososphaerales archaeon]